MPTDNWGFTDVEAAVASIPSWIKHVEWKGSSVDVNRWIVTGHSNGGMYMAGYPRCCLFTLHRSRILVCSYTSTRQNSSRSSYFRLRFYTEYISTVNNYRSQSNDTQNMSHSNYGSPWTQGAQQSLAAHSTATATRCSWRTPEASRYSNSTVR